MVQLGKDQSLGMAYSFVERFLFLTEEEPICQLAVEECALNTDN